MVDDESVIPIPTVIEEKMTVGLDVGISHFLVDSEGNKTDNPKMLSASLWKLANRQKEFSRKKKGSNNRARQRRVVALLHEKVANQRLDFIHNVTAELADKNQATSFAVEDLNIKGMQKNRKLSRAISDCSWGMLLNTLDYKCKWNGKNLLKINRFAPSSKTCSQCGEKQVEMPLKIRVWKCQCGANHDRDINAALMIKQFAIADALGQSVCVKRTPSAMPVSAGALAKGSESTTLIESQEASTKREALSGGSMSPVVNEQYSTFVRS